MNEFHFLRPAWFWLLLPLALLLLWFWRGQLRSRSWQSVCDPQLLPYLLLGRSQRRGNWPLALILLALLLAVTALAGPVWERQPQPLFRQQSALVLLYDLSASMLAEDLKPNRLTRARLKIADILRQRREGQTALVVFAGDAFTVTPLTDDAKTIAALLDSLEPGLMPVFGSRPELAIARGRELLQQAGMAEGDLLLVTDEDQPESAMTAVEELRRNGYRLSVLGVGTAEGAPIPLRDGGFFKDETGQLVLPQLKPTGLQQLAQAGGGKYQTLRVDDRDIRQLLSRPLQDRLDKERRQSEQVGDRWREEGVWLLWPLALLAACAFRRGWLTVIVFFWLLPAPVQAFDWQQLWTRPDQQGAQAFEQQDYQAAQQRFEDHRWQASAAYRAGEYAGAVKLLEAPETADDYYNLGNALAKSGRLAEALNAYKQALKLNPDDEDASENKRLIEETLKEQEQDPQSQQGDSSEQDDASSEGSEQNRQQSQDPQQERSESADGEQQQQDSAEAPQSPAEDSSEKEQQQAEESGEQERQEAEAQSESEAEAEQEKAKQQQAAQHTESEPLSEEERATQQWLQRIPDDPGGLLRRKFLYQYRQRERRSESGKQW